MKVEVMSYSRRRAPSILAFLIVASWLSGCGSEPVVNSDEPIGETQSALPASLGTWTDWSGTVNVAAWQCDWVGPSARPVASCAIPDSTYVLVGGGAEITTTGNSGAMLTKSYPVEAHAADLSTWRAESKDHVYSNPHHLRAFAVGLKLTGLTAAQLRGQMIVGMATSEPSASPTASGQLPTGYLVTSVGAYTNFSGAGQMLTEVGGAGGAFGARSKDHLVADPSSITASAIGVKKCPTGYAGGCLENFAMIGANNNPMTGYMKVVQANSGFALTGVGGNAWNPNGGGAGRMMVTMRVGNQVVEVWSKDHGVVDAENLVSFSIGLQKKP